jgi:hypothetical protein
MAKGIRHYSKIVRREAYDGPTTRHIVVEETAGVIHLVISEVGPIKDRDGNTIGYDVRPASRQWFLTFKEALSAAEIALNSSLDSGFHEVSADTSVGN